jgi:flagellar protein FliO/FliZ
MLLVKLRESRSSDKSSYFIRGCALLPLILTSSAFAQSTQSITNPASVVSIFLSLLVVVAIIFALAYVMRRLNVTTMGNGQMKVVASMVAGTKEKIMVIEVGDEQHLVGVTAHTITHLSKLDAKLETPQRESKPGGELFKQKLVAAMAGKINPAIKEDKHDA